jgi:hypothetical protein
MVKSKTSKLVIFLTFMLIIVEAFGQCKAKFVYDFGEGRVLTRRTGGLSYVTDCEEVLKKTYEPNFVFDTSWSIEDIIKTERGFYLNENCKKYKVTPDFNDCVRELISVDDKKRLESIRKLICFYDNKDSTFIILKNQFPQIQNERTKALVARNLLYSKNPEAIMSLAEIANDSCEYVRLEVARSLSWLGEKTIGYNTLMNPSYLKVQQGQLMLTSKERYLFNY